MRDPQWKYVNLRRHFTYVEPSIDHGTQWVVFDPNGDLLWGNIRRCDGLSLYNSTRFG